MARRSKRPFTRLPFFKHQNRSRVPLSWEHTTWLPTFYIKQDALRLAYCAHEIGRPFTKHDIGNWFPDATTKELDKLVGYCQHWSFIRKVARAFWVFNSFGLFGRVTDSTLYLNLLRVLPHVNQQNLQHKTRISINPRVFWRSIHMDEPMPAIYAEAIAEVLLDIQGYISDYINAWDDIKRRGAIGEGDWIRWEGFQKMMEGNIEGLKVRMTRRPKSLLDPEPEETDEETWYNETVEYFEPEIDEDDEYEYY